jgi:ABC-type nitrate/sulfonate/bicarbonate transport system substrate-binding protein
MKNKLIIGLSVVVIALLIWVFLTPDRKKEKVRVCYPPTLIASLPHWVAMDKGFYRDEGIEPIELPFADSKTMISSLYNNDADYLPAVSFADFSLNSKEFGTKFPPIIISHSRFRREPNFESLLVLNNSKISSLKDLENKTIAVYPGVTSLNVVKYFLSQNGVNTSNITFLPMPPSEHIDLLIKGDIDCSHLYEPSKAQALMNSNIKELYNGVYASLNEPSAFGISVISRKFYTEQPELAKKIIKVWNRSITFIRENDSEARLILMKELKLSEKVSMKAVWVDATLTTEISEEILQKTIHSFQKVFNDSTFQLTSDYLLKK